MTDEEQLVLSRLALAVGERAAVGEVELAQLLWGLLAEAAIAEDRHGKPQALKSMRRRIRKIVEELRLGYNEPILDSAAGYFVSDDRIEIDRFCHARRTRGITSLVIESIVRKSRPLDMGVQRFFDFLRSEEQRRRRIAERRGETFTPIDRREVVDAVTRGVEHLEGEQDGTTEDAPAERSGTGETLRH